MEIWNPLIPSLIACAFAITLCVGQDRIDDFNMKAFEVEQKVNAALRAALGTRPALPCFTR
jgi:hypothetical protein